jgi:hypothetical protein
MRLYLLKKTTIFGLVFNLFHHFFSKYSMNSHFSFIPWKKQLFLRGQVVVGSLNTDKVGGNFKIDPKEFGLKPAENDEKPLPKRALIGRATLKECLTRREFIREVYYYYH